LLGIQADQTITKPATNIMIHLFLVMVLASTSRGDGQNLGNHLDLNIHIIIYVKISSEIFVIRTLKTSVCEDWKDRSKLNLLFGIAGLNLPRGKLNLFFHSSPLLKQKI
jgi:hypothetical protein